MTLLAGREVSLAASGAGDDPARAPARTKRDQGPAAGLMAPSTIPCIVMRASDQVPLRSLGAAQQPGQLAEGKRDRASVRAESVGNRM